jgi:hypothetical protein
MPHGLVKLRGATLRQVTAAGVTTEVLSDAETFERVLRERFDLVLPDARDLWPRVWERHLAWQAEQVRAGS